MALQPSDQVNTLTKVTDRHPAFVLAGCTGAETVSLLKHTTCSSTYTDQLEVRHIL